MILLTLQNVTKSFAMNTVLKDVNLTLQAGSRMGLVGVNGSGKSTLFRLISGVMEPDSGTISLMKGARVGVLTQDADIQSDLTIQQELERVLSRCAKWSASCAIWRPRWPRNTTIPPPSTSSPRPTPG